MASAPMGALKRAVVVTIRTANPQDSASLAAIAEHTFREAFGTDNSLEDLELHCAQNFHAEIQGREIADPQLITLLAEFAGKLVGFAQLRLDKAKSSVHGERPAELNRFYIASEWHGRGVAHDLMRAVLMSASRAGSDCVWLGVWEQNPRAIAFYGKFGFQAVGHHTFMVGRDPQRDLILATDIVDPCAG